jgi:hypothetical protein
MEAISPQPSIAVCPLHHRTRRRHGLEIEQRTGCTLAPAKGPISERHFIVSHSN